MVPAKEDKWYVHLVTRSYYGVLIEAGVEVYEYTPALAALRADVEATLAASRRVSLDEMAEVGPVRRLGKAVLRTFAPAM